MAGMSEGEQSAEQFEAGPAEWRVRDALTAALGRAERGEVDPRPAARPRRVERPAPPPAGKAISFNAAMARALAAGHKTQTRRPIRPPAAGQIVHQGRPWPADSTGRPIRCTLATAGERVWVREPWTPAASGRGVEYEADLGPAAAKQKRWRPGRFMGQDKSRLTLLVTDVLPQRLTAITPGEAAAEGVAPGVLADESFDAVAWFRDLWDSIYGRDAELAWSADPWVWVVRFRLWNEPSPRTRSARAG